MAGKQVLSTDIQDGCGRIALGLTVLFQQAANVNAYLVAQTTENLVALGIPEADVLILKSAFADLAYMKAQSFESSAFIKQIIGLGI